LGTRTSSVGVTHLAQHRPVGQHKLGRRSGGVVQDRDLGAAGVHFRLDHLKSRGGFGLRDLQLQSLEHVGDLGALLRGHLFLLPFPAGHAHEHLALGDEDVGEGDAIVGERQLSNLVRVPGAARFHDRQGAVALAVVHDVRDVDPGVGDGGNAGCGRLVGVEPIHQGGIHHRDSRTGARWDRGWSVASLPS
jgi:hypothetical protein